LFQFVIIFCEEERVSWYKKEGGKIMPLKRCIAPTCREYIDWTERYCTKHQGYADK